MHERVKIMQNWNGFHRLKLIFTLRIWYPIYYSNPNPHKHMPLKCKILDTGKKRAEENMQLDADLLASMDQEPLPILHLYDWEGKSITYGHFILPETLLNLEAANERGYSLAKRPTGGGIVFHTCDLAFSFLMPAQFPEFSQNTLKNYHFVNRRVIDAIASFMKESLSLELLDHDPKANVKISSFCMAKPTIYDVMVRGRKVGGAAQRKTVKGFLHQGTISLVPLEEEAKQAILPDQEIIKLMEENSFPLLKDHLTDPGLALARQEMKKALIGAFSI